MTLVGWNLVYARAQSDPQSRQGAWRRPVARLCRCPRNRRSLDGRYCLDCGKAVRP